MKFLVASVGRPRDRRLASLHDEWAERLRKLGVGYDTSFVPEVRSGGRYSDAHVRARETRSLVAAVRGPGRVIALDPAGRTFTSDELAKRLEAWGTPRAAFLIGGPLGLDPDLAEEADFTLSLSRLTFSHELARAVLAEQLYRAVTILRGLPYHKGNPGVARTG